MFRQPEVKIKVSAVLVYSRGLRERAFLLSPVIAGNSWLVAASQSLPPHHTAPSLSPHAAFAYVCLPVSSAKSTRHIVLRACSTSVQGCPVCKVVKNPPVSAGDTEVGSIPGLGRFPGVGNANLLEFSCLKNSRDREACSATVQRITKRWTRLSS